MDADGFLSITDRKKELLKTSGGKLIAPQPIENKLKAHSLVGNAALVGDKHKFACVLISPNFAILESWAKVKGVAFTDRKDLVKQERGGGAVPADCERGECDAGAVRDHQADRAWCRTSGRSRGRADAQHEAEAARGGEKVRGGVGGFLQGRGDRNSVGTRGGGSMDGAGTEVTIRPFREGDGEAFRVLNEAWIGQLFGIEEKDRTTLGDPEGNIRAKGGQIC